MASLINALGFSDDPEVEFVIWFLSTPMKRYLALHRVSNSLPQSHPLSDVSQFDMWKAVVPAFTGQVLSIWLARHLASPFKLWTSLERVPKFWRALTQSLCGGLIVRTIVYPLQTLEHLVGYLDVSSPPAYSGVVDCAQKVVAKHGIGGLYCGFGACALALVSARLAFFFGTRIARRYVPEINHTGTWTTIAHILCTVVAYPFHTVQLQALSQIPTAGICESSFAAARQVSWGPPYHFSTTVLALLYPLDYPFGDWLRDENWSERKRVFS